MSLMEISKSIPPNLDYSERNQILPKNDTRKSKNSQKMVPQNPGIAQKVPKNPGAIPKVPKIMAHPRIMTYASYPPPPPKKENGEIDRFNLSLLTESF